MHVLLLIVLTIILLTLVCVIHLVPNHVVHIKYVIAYMHIYTYSYNVLNYTSIITINIIEYALRPTFVDEWWGLPTPPQDSWVC